MPQFETATYISQFFWLIICFISLWGIMSLFIVPKIEDILEQRRLKIDDYLQKAEEVNKQAMQSLQKYEKAIATAKQEAEKSILCSKADLEKSSAEKQLELNESLARKVAQNEQTIEKKRADALRDVDILALGLAADMLRKISGTDPKPQDLKDLLKEKN